MPLVLTTPFLGAEIPAAAFIYNGGGGGTNTWSTPGDPSNFSASNESVMGWAPDAMATNGLGQAVAWRTGGTVNTKWSRTTDGLTWTDFNIPGINSAGGMAWDTSDNKWKAIGATTITGTGFICAESSDLISWTTLFSTADNTILQSGSGHTLIADGTDLIAAAQRQSPVQQVIAVSTDGGTNWGVTNNAAITAAGENHGNMFYEGGIYYLMCSDSVVHNGLYSSPSGLANSFTARVTYGAFDNPLQIKYGNGVWILAGFSTPDTSTRFMRSTDGFNFTTIPGSWESSGSDHWPLSYDSTYGWLYTTTNNWKWSTDDGVTWNDTNFGASPPLGRANMRFK